MSAQFTILRLVGVVAVGLLLTPECVRAQATPKVLYACYVPNTGTVYRIKEPGLKSQCTGSNHVEFSWIDGLPDYDHGRLNGLGDDDHPQYLLADGTRALAGHLSLGGFRITGLAAGTEASDAVRFDQAMKSGDAAGGDLAGTYPNPRLATLLGRPVASVELARGDQPSEFVVQKGDVVTFDGSAWTAATPAQGITDHGLLGGLADDDHTQYLLTDGVRTATNGFAVTGTFGNGTIPASGPGTRLMWYPGKSAFRVGSVDAGQWDDANVGQFSTAMGLLTTASGTVSTALGSHTTASGLDATAMGSLTTASGRRSVAMGVLASTNGFPGSFVYGDESTFGTGALVEATGANQFVVRAAGGTIFYSNSDLTAGVSLAPGAGAWASVSDVNRKENFRELNGEGVLARIARLPIREWNYKAQPPSIRHLGPTAQDFHAAFGLGESDTTITTIDPDGVSLLAIQALVRRTAELPEAVRELAALRAESVLLRAELHALKTEIARQRVILDSLVASRAR